MRGKESQREVKIVKESQREPERMKESQRDAIVAMKAHADGPVRKDCSVFIEDGW